MIPRERFLASKSADEQAWLEARRTGVTATEVAQAATPAGFRDALEQRRNPQPIEVNAYMEFGLLWEDWVIDKIAREYDIKPNDYLIAGEYSKHLATPDGLSTDHRVIAEVKTTGKDWGVAEKLPIRYARQIQWQLHVTGAEFCVIAWLLRDVTDTGVFVPAWFKPKVGVIERDREMISKLVEVAGRLLDAG
jgi:predicted phage-related endonuclease